MTLRRLWLPLLAGLLAPPAAVADDVGLANASGVGVRALGMGGAYVAVATGAPAVFHNPAALGVGAGVAMFAQTNVSGRDELKIDPKGIAYRWRAWGLGWGNKLTIPARGISDYTYWSLGHQLAPYVSAGFSVKLWRTHPSEHFQVFGSSAAYDVGVLAALGRHARLGVRVGQHVRAGRIADLTIGVAQRVGRGTVAAQGDWRADEAAWLRLGCELPIAGCLYVRAGWRDEAPTAGLGVRIGHVMLNGAWTRLEEARTVLVSADVEM